VRNNVEGIIVSNTTLARPGLKHKDHAKEAGGLSGAPLFARSTRMLARVHQMTAGTVPLIGVGGIDSGERAVEKMRAGASLVQLYTGLVYEGPELLGEIKQALIAELDKTGADSISDIVGTQAKEWAARPLEEFV
jgi:dihydroorotate dehydrogenase